MKNENILTGIEKENAIAEINAKLAIKSENNRVDGVYNLLWHRLTAKRDAELSKVNNYKTTAQWLKDKNGKNHIECIDKMISKVNAKLINKPAFNWLGKYNEWETDVDEIRNETYIMLVEYATDTNNDIKHDVFGKVLYNNVCSAMARIWRDYFKHDNAQLWIENDNGKRTCVIDTELYKTRDSIAPIVAVDNAIENALLYGACKDETDVMIIRAMKKGYSVLDIAKGLNVHRNTINYRFKKIAERYFNGGVFNTAFVDVDIETMFDNEFINDATLTDVNGTDKTYNGNADAVIGTSENDNYATTANWSYKHSTSHGRTRKIGKEKVIHKGRAVVASDRLQTMRERARADAYKNAIETMTRDDVIMTADVVAKRAVAMSLKRAVVDTNENAKRTASVAMKTNDSNDKRTASVAIARARNVSRVMSIKRDNEYKLYALSNIG